MHNWDRKMQAEIMDYGWVISVWDICIGYSAVADGDIYYNELAFRVCVSGIVHELDCLIY